jgi:plastocyanin
MLRSRRLAPLSALACAAMLLAACGGAAESPTAAGDGGGEGGGGGSPAAEGTTVTISGNSFGDNITVAAGTTVTFVNEDSVGHTVTNGQDGEPAADAAFDEPVAAGESVEIPFDEAGTFDVTCTIHPSMNMTVTVEG